MHHERERQKTENESRKPMFEKPKYERHIKFFNSSGKFFPQSLLTLQFERLRTISVTRVFHNCTRIPTVKLKIPGKIWENQDPELLLHSSYSF